MATPFPITLLQQREIEARIIGPIFQAFAAEIGEERALEILRTVIEGLARDGGCATAAALGGNSLAHLQQAVEVWRKGDALELTVIQSDEQTFAFHVTRCRFAEMYRALGLEKLGFVLSCNRDAAMIEGFNPELVLNRPLTIMNGHNHCNFTYRLNN